jgi:hypothetical protein
MMKKLLNLVAVLYYIMNLFLFTNPNSILQPKSKTDRRAMVLDKWFKSGITMQRWLKKSLNLKLVKGWYKRWSKDCSGRS